jgi:hypothetical protein
VGDAVAIGVVVAFVALAALYISACERIVGKDEPVPVAPDVADEEQAA